MKRALFELAPHARFDWVALGDFPTRVDRIELARGEVWVKRDDLSSPIYGGNKVRTLETLFGEAKARGARRIYAAGAYGSNHATATVLHAPRAGLEPGAILFPQPVSSAAVENLRVTLAARPRLVSLPHWSVLPLGMAWVRRRDRAQGVRSALMMPGGATEVGALGYVSAALELAAQIDAGVLPAPAQLVVGVGSTCTSAGLLLGLRIAASRGWGGGRVPTLVAARVTPWPVTSAFRIVDLATRTGRLLRDRTGDASLAPTRRELAEGLEIDGRYLGAGYGRPTPEGRDAIRCFGECAGLELDTTYSAKAAACALSRLGRGPVLYWSTKSTASLPETRPSDWDWAPRVMRGWIRRAQRSA